MPITRTATIRMLRLISVISIILIIVIYASWRSLDYIRGPKIFIFEPKDGYISDSLTVSVSGRADRVISTSINGKEIQVDEKGNWKELLVVFPGQNIITIEAKDRFGRKISQELNVSGPSI